MAVVPTPPTITGGILTSSQLNQYRDAINFTENPPILETRQSIVQSIPNATFTALLFDVNEKDSVNGHSTSVNTSRYTAVYAGWYVCSGAYAVALNATGNRGVRWAVNGTLLNGSDGWVPGTGTSNNTVVARTKRIFLNVGDYVELQAFQASGGALNTSVTGEAMSSMSVQWVSN
jgi:hypothetical protein